MDEFHNPWIDAPQIQTAIQSACRAYVKAEKYETALLLGNLLVRLIPRIEALKVTAEIHRTWADNLLEEAEHLPPEKADEHRKLARQQLRRAGDCYTELAREYFTTHAYTEQVWIAAEAYFAGHDFRSAARMFRIYIANESHLRRRRRWSI